MAVLMAAQEHMDRLSAIDASFLAGEKESSHMHVGAVMIFEGPPLGREDMLEQIGSRLHLVPRYRQKLAVPRFEMGRPLWVDDPSFNLEYHVRHTALASPGDLQQLRLLTARIFSQRLDRSKPLWEVWFVQGLEADRFAIISKTHHALVDGISGVDLATVLFDLSPVPPERTDTPEWTPHPEPSQAQLIAEGVKGLLRRPLEISRSAVDAALHPEKTVTRVREAAEGIGEVAWAGMNPAPETPLNVPIGSHRRIVWIETELEHFKAIKNSLGGTVNDVVLAVVSGALARWLRTRGVRTEGLELRAQVPVSIRSEDEHDRLGNRIAALRAPLPVYARDPVERLRIVRESMQGVKESKQALAAQMITGLEDFAPPTILSMAARTHWSPRLFNMIVTNVPGPQFPIYLQGRELQELVPVAFLPENFALTIAAMSYNGKLEFSLLGDYDAMPDIDLVGDYVAEALEELLVAAGKPPNNRGRTSRPRSSARESTVG
ncbi:MAG TPA: wax ester/triacylglycerol synthase family O-acyltransferase [Thermoleophilaceae bacterium]|jgi:WS/DGAT/MGAT family acyltransferase|nr:wax ester/triacylglycerol synthase family O-acyltransferase [Thermoleophilaceae bacterium]